MRKVKNVTLQEKINQENKEINEIIGKVLRSKTVARKYEDKLKELGITVDYSEPQGVVLTGSNGRKLEASRDYIGGPAKPGRNGTHDRGYTSYARYKKEYEKELNDLKALKRDDIIRKYPNLSSKDALAKHKGDIERAQSNYDYYDKEAKAEARSAKVERRRGHLDNPRTHSWNKTFGKPFADAHVDYLNYLTKPNYGDDFRDKTTYNIEVQKDDDNHWTKTDHVKNPVSYKQADDIVKYNKLKYDINQAKGNVKWHTYDSGGSYNSSYAAMTDEELEAKIKKMRDDLEKEIESLRKSNANNVKGRDEDIAELKKREKELDNFLKAKGIRESMNYYKDINLKRLEAVLQESEKESTK